MMIEELITKLRLKLLQNQSLEVFCYQRIIGNQSLIRQFDKSNFTGEVEQIVIKSFLDEFAETDELKKILNRIEKNSIQLTVYHYIGLFYQDKLNETTLFFQIIKNYFKTHSFKFKYLLVKVFPEFEDALKIKLQAEIESKDSFISVLKHLYLETDINKNQALTAFEKEFDNLDITDLLLLEDLQNNARGYNRTQEKLLNDIIWCASEIQSKHKVLNNNEDQYNSNFQSLLKAKDYKTEPQTQRGESYSKTQYGELDIAIFTKDNFPLSIFEAFVITSIDSEYIKAHLKKLSENYDPNGLKNNYAVIYAKHSDFNSFWERYKNFVPTIDFEHQIISGQIDDITSRYPEFAGIRLGLTRHINRGFPVQIYHIFMDMNF